MALYNPANSLNQRMINGITTKDSIHIRGKSIGLDIFNPMVCQAQLSLPNS